jgi:hypothetical protein
MSFPEGPFAAVSVALRRVLGSWPGGEPPDGTVLRIHPALWDELRADPGAPWSPEHLPRVARWYGIPVQVTAEVIPGHLAELTVPSPGDPGLFAAYCVLPANADAPGYSVAHVTLPLGDVGAENLAAALGPPRLLPGDQQFGIPADTASAGSAPAFALPDGWQPRERHESVAFGLWQPLETARQAYHWHLDALAGEHPVDLEAAMRYLRATYSAAEADAYAAIEGAVDLAADPAGPGSGVTAVGRVYGVALEVAREVLRTQLAAAIRILALYGVPVEQLAAVLDGATELGGAVTDLNALPGDAAVTVAAGPGRIPELWLHAAPGVWVGPAGADPVAEDLTAEQVTAAQARELAAAAWKRAGRDVG